MKKAFRLLIAAAFLAASATTLSAQTWDVYMDAGEKAEQRRDYETAMHHFLSAARLGAPVGMNGVGRLHLLRQDFRRAYVWCTAAGLSYGHATDFGCLMESEAKLKPAEIKTLNELALQCLASQATSCEQIDPSQQRNIDAYNQTKCVVTDPTGSKLNARTGPNGKILQAIANGVGVNVLDSTKDSQGREWSYIESSEGGTALGWVFKRYLTCGKERYAEATVAQQPAAPLAPSVSPPRILEIIPSSNRSPAGEKVENALDRNPNTKYLNFDKLNAGFTIHLSQQATLDSLQLTTANDFVGRDPTSITISGSNDGRNWRDLMSDMPIALPKTRKTKGDLIYITSPGAFAYYRVIFPTVKNMDRTCGRDCDSVQIADVDLNYK